MLPGKPCHQMSQCGNGTVATPELCDEATSSNTTYARPPTASSLSCRDVHPLQHALNLLVPVSLNRSAPKPGGVIVGQAVQQVEAGKSALATSAIHADLMSRGLRKNNAHGHGEPENLGKEIALNQCHFHIPINRRFCLVRDSDEKLWIERGQARKKGNHLLPQALNRYPSFIAWKLDCCARKQEVHNEATSLT